MGRLREKISRKNYQVSAGGFACLRTRLGLTFNRQQPTMSYEKAARPMMASLFGGLQRVGRRILNWSLP
ncbi:MAG: hypothetical protein ACP5O7_08475, partial [Phycisphaerae bacterium]